MQKELVQRALVYARGITFDVINNDPLANVDNLDVWKGGLLDGLIRLFVLPYARIIVDDSFVRVPAPILNACCQLKVSTDTSID